MSLVCRKMRVLWRTFTVKRLCYTSFILFLTSYLLSSFFFMFISSFDFMYSFNQYLPDDVSCYFETNYKDIYDEYYLNITHSDDVFMHYTPCHFNMKPAHLCAIEAASLAYPRKKVNILFNKPLSFCACQQNVIGQILQTGNVEFIRLQIEKHLVTTPFKTIIGPFVSSVLNRGMRRYKKVENMLKLATLYNYGGRIIDMDVIVTEPVHNVNKWLIWEYDDLVSPAALAFSQKKDDIIKISIE